VQANPRDGITGQLRDVRLAYRGLIKRSGVSNRGAGMRRTTYSTEARHQTLFVGADGPNFGDQVKTSGFSMHNPRNGASDARAHIITLPVAEHA